MHKTRNHLILCILLVSALFLAGCSADDLQKTGESMGNIGKAGIGNAGESLVSDAVETVDAFVSNYEFCIRYYDPLFVIDEEKEKAQAMLLKNEKDDGYDGAKGLRELAASVVSQIGKATETSSSDKALREALAKPYSEPGVTYGRPVFRRFGDALEGSLTGSGIVSMLAMLATMGGVNLPPGLVENITGYIVPIPTQAYDVLPLLENKAMVLASYIMELVQYNKDHPKPTPEPEPGTPFDFSTLLSIPEGIAANTGDRKYQTVGDKISFALLYDIFDVAESVFVDYRKTHLVDPNDENSDVDYAEFGFDWIMKNCSRYIDRVVADVNTIGYINGTHIDAAGIIGSYVSGL